MIVDTAMQLCDIVRYGLQNKLYVSPIMNEQELFSMAKENGLSGFIYTTLNNESTSSKLLSSLKKEHYLYIAQGTRQDQVLEDIKDILTTNNIRHIFLKGSTLRELYPKTYMRSMGDIDVLVDESNMKQIHSLFESQEYKNLYNSSAHDGFQHLNGSVIEIHPQITRKIEGHDVKLFIDSWANAFIEDGYTYKLQPEYELAYLMYHAAKHFKSSGVGLRTLLDIGLYAQAYEASIDKNLLLNMFAKTNLSTFAKNIFKLQFYYFQIPALKNLYDKETMSNEFKNFMTRYITISGVHGTGDGFNRTMVKMAQLGVKHPKIQYLLKSLFPSLSGISNQYSFVRNKWLLYPIGWFIRTFRLLTIRLKSSINKLRQTSISKTHLAKATEMLKELGL